ncbi:MAG: hypothetical protein ACPIOQ_46795, partial [Promethearchaeia archaeon]
MRAQVCMRALHTHSRALAGETATLWTVLKALEARLDAQAHHHLSCSLPPLASQADSPSDPQTGKRRAGGRWEGLRVDTDLARAEDDEREGGERREAEYVQGRLHTLQGWVRVCVRTCVFLQYLPANQYPYPSMPGRVDLTQCLDALLGRAAAFVRAGMPELASLDIREGFQLDPHNEALKALESRCLALSQASGALQKGPSVSCHPPDAIARLERHAITRSLLPGWS